jgi:urea carboxylase-associated protein 2
VATQPTVPARDATDLPPGVAGGDVIWDETIGGGNYASRALARGSVVRLTDVEGSACVQLLAFNALQPSERLNVADTVKVQWQAYLGAGTVLLTDLGRPLLRILEDTSGRHDAFAGASTRRSNEARYGAGAIDGPYPNARDRFAVAVAKHGLDRRDVHPCVSFFQGVRVEPDGSLRFTGSAGPGTWIELRCELPALLVFANTPHPLDPRDEYVATPVRTTAYRSAAAPDRDGLSPEMQRAYENLDDYLLGHPILDSSS